MMVHDPWKREAQAWREKAEQWEGRHKADTMAYATALTLLRTKIRVLEDRLRERSEPKP